MLKMLKNVVKNLPSVSRILSCLSVLDLVRRTMKWQVCVVIFISLVVFGVFAEGEPKVCFNAGCVRGTTSLGYERPYEAFLGIPYARPPIEGQRFRNPEPNEGWTNVRDCTKPANICPQRDLLGGTGGFIGNEDCLYLNVYRPLLTNPQTQRLPVIAFIHGGAFLFGSAHPDFYGPDYFMDNGTVILVTIQYRLGALGFLCSGDSASQGNFGLKDQVLALKWIQDNIMKFGGNPRLVTVMGQSAGAVSAQVLMTNSQTRYFFRRAIFLSGSMISDWSVTDNPVKLFRDIASAVELSNPTTRSTQDLTEEMRTLDVKEILAASSKIQTKDRRVMYKMCLEGRWPGALIQEDPREMWKKGLYRHRSWLMGVVGNEGTIGINIVNNETILEKFNEDLDKNIADFLEISEDQVPSVRSFYLGGSDTINESNKMNFLKMINDRLFYYPFYESVRQYIQYGSNKGTPVFLTKFNYRGSQSYTSKIYQLPSNHEFGVGHSDDLDFLFPSAALFPERIPKDSLDAKVAKKYVNTLIEFAVTGRPLNGANVRKCNRANFDPFCDYQEFRKKSLEVKLPTEIIEQHADLEVIVTNSFDIEMVSFWKALLSD
ncbi:juvenile hormone esterase-like [Lutzomyia longipalpis]|uniref:juvenile hormone esterase-like n=1 Tax=Lutzomyia longipalpis TaxID=7200 RepID=UPI00248371F6|nr:juvenile hormone esterase-like [Lutzomyia longipalpis]